MVFAIFFIFVGLWPLRFHQHARVWALVVGGLFLLIAGLRPGWLHPLNQVWTKLGLLLGRLVSPIAAAVLFGLVFTPAGWLFRLLGKDLLRLSYDRKAHSYWIERQPPGPPPETMSNQF